MAQVARVATPVSAQALANAIASAWPSVLGGPAVTAAVLVLVAQSAFETGGWGACWNYNFGNVKHVPGDGYDFYVMTAPEAGGVQVASQWRSYPDLETAAGAFLNTIARGWSRAFRYALAGDPSGYAYALGNGGYYTGSESQYAAGVTSWYKRLGGIVPALLAVPTWVLATGGALIGVGSWYLYRWLNDGKSR